MARRRAQWVDVACTDWTAATGGNLQPGRVARVLAPLVRQHDPDAVLGALRRYLLETPPEFASVDGFASRAGVWLGRPGDVSRDDLRALAPPPPVRELVQATTMN